MNGRGQPFILIGKALRGDAAVSKTAQQGSSPCAGAIKKTKEEMAEYHILAKVNQIVSKEVRFLVTAASEEEAMQKAREVLQTYPEASKVKGVRRVVTDKAHYWIPRDIEFIEIQEDKKLA